jgi:hypothetical protein
LTKTQEAIGVRNDGGDIVGVVDRETFIRILAGADIK